MIDWTNASRIDGPRFVAWLQSAAYEDLARAVAPPDTPVMNLYCSAERWLSDALSRAKNGRPISYALVDRIVTRLGLHVSQVPDGLWTHEGPVREDASGGRWGSECAGCGCEFSIYTDGCLPCANRRRGREFRERRVAA